MPSAQGHITVRRRAKDGTNGSDAVRYWVIPSATQIKRAQDGTMSPATVTCEKRKQTGNAAPIVINEGILYYQIGYEDGSVTGKSIYGSTGVKATKAMTWIKFILEVSQVEVASETVSVVRDGDDVYLLDLDNEMQGIPCNSSGTPTGSGTLASTNSTVYKGAKVDSGWTYSKEDTGCTSTIDKNGTVSVTAISADKASVKVIATKDSLTLSAVMSLYKVKPGANGSSPVVYSIEVSASSISRDKNGSLNPTSITAYKQKTVGNATARTTEMVLKYLREGQDSTETTLSGQGGEIKDLSAACTAVVITLYSGTSVLDKERIPIVKDGQDGSDVYLLDLDNEVEGIPCNSSGTPTGSGTLASTNSTVYKGAKVDSGWTYSKEDTGCTSTIDKNGTVSVTAISADKASVKVIATKDSLTLSAVMSLYKVKPGANGSSPVVYSLEISDKALSRDAAGKLTPDSISVYKNKTVGSTKNRTTEMTLTYQRIGQDTGPIIYAGQGGSIANISDDCTAIELKLKNGNTVLDSERVPIVKDGKNGIDGVDGNPGADGFTIIVSPANVEFNFSKTSRQTIRIDVYQGSKKLTYNDDFLCSTLSSQTTITTGLRWGFNVDTDGFYFTLTYTVGNDVNINIPFVITVGDIQFNRVICVKTVKNGDPGPQGIQGCVYRRSKHVIGFDYHNDSALTTNGIRYIDLVYIMKDSTMYASHALWFRCKKSHKSDANNAPQKTNTGNEAWLEYWEPMNTLEPLYTPFLLADDAVITLMQSNQILIANDEGVITAGMSGSLAGSKIRIWAGSQTPDSAPFRVDVNGKLTSTEADIRGKITATSGTIAGFNISGTALTNGPDFSNDACIIFRNDSHKTFAGIGGNVLPATTGNRAVARFENEDSNNFWGLGRNIAMLLSAKNGDINHAFLGTGNGNLDGWIDGYKFSKYTLNDSNTIYNGYMKISQNNRWIIYATGSSSGITLPTLTEVRNALGIGTSTSFCIELTVVADLHSQHNFNVYGRCKKTVTVNGASQTPYFTGEYPTMTHWNNGRYDSLEMGAGDSAVFLLIYDPGKTGVLDTDYTLMYTARIINRQN